MYYPTRTARGPRIPPVYTARVPPLPQPREAPLTPSQAVGLFLFLLVNISLFIRPADVVPN